MPKQKTADVAALLLLLAGCGTEQARDPADNIAGAEANAAAAKALPPPTAEQLAISGAAAEALGRYYTHIGRGDYRAAFAMRERRPGLGYERFAASFEPYGDYRATIGTPSYPAEQDGTLWVEVPVQLYGRMRDGSPFGSVGRVTMKRPRGIEAWQVAP
jgi:hypothetical protein